VRTALAGQRAEPSDADDPRAWRDRVQFVTSGDVETFRRLGARFCGPEVRTVEAWAWN